MHKENSENPIAALFPGQGSQYAGMNRVLLEQFPWTREIYEEASDAIGVDIKKLCLDGPEADLQQTENAQPAILTTSYAWFQVLRRNLDFYPSAAGGHSLGEYSALLAAEALSLPSAVQLVRERGRLMQQAVPVGRGKMAAILGLSDENTLKLCQAATQPGSIVVPANFNSPGQVVVAGNAEAVDRAEKLATSGEVPELKARKFIPLKVSAPFHCPLMKPVAEKFEASLKGVSWKERTFPIAHNLDAVVRKEGDLVSLLRDQIDHPVRWTQCQQALRALGNTCYVEMGPGKVLSGLGKRISGDAVFFNLETADDVKKFELKLQELRK
jgi:[acyl-carrier-protein] S-malonyltransferase